MGNINLLTKNRHSIGIDMDDTIENLIDAWCAYLNKKYGYSYTDEDITDWDLQKTYTELTNDQIFEPLYDSEFWKTVKVKLDAVKYIKKLQDDGFNVFICTNSHYTTICSKIENILLKHFPYITWNQVIIGKYKSICKFDVMVDDYPPNLIYGSYLRVLYDTPHNRDINDAEFSINRFKNWKEIYEFITKYYKDKEKIIGELELQSCL